MATGRPKLTLLVKPITFFDEKLVLACDGRCDKAWGINTRPRHQLSDDPDDYEFLADGELGEAPADPGTYEGNHAKPAPSDGPYRQNKWCARECERSVMGVGDLLPPDLSARVRNRP